MTTALSLLPLAARALEVLPAGSNGEFNLPPDLVRIIVSGAGCRVRDESGAELLDFSMGWGSVLPGHAHPEIVAAVQQRVALGTNFAFPSDEAVRLADQLCQICPALRCGRVRFCASGTEATMYCLRLARAYTRRRLVLKFEGAYHGSNDEGTTSLFPSGRSDFPEPEPSSAGISAGRTLVAPYNNLQLTRAIIARHASDLAGVIVEPLQRCLTPESGFLAGLRESCTAHSVPLIFDEVVTGFRMALGGAQELYGVTPDLVAYGKALGGGLPIGAFGGRAEIMDLMREDRAGMRDYVWSASTLGGNPISCAAANTALAMYRRPETYPNLRGLGERFRAGLARTARDAGHEAQVIGDGPLGQIVFSAAPVIDYRSTIAGDRAKARAMMLGLCRTGVFLNPMGTKLYLSLAHDDAACDEFLSRLAMVLREL